MSAIKDGAGISLDRQFSMIRFIKRAGKKGATLTEIRMFMTVTHGMSDEWVTKYLKKWLGFKVVKKVTRGFNIDEKMLEIVWKMRDEEASSLEG